MPYASIWTVGEVLALALALEGSCGVSSVSALGAMFVCIIGIHVLIMRILDEIRGPLKKL